MLDLKGPGHLYCTWICTQYTHTYNSWHMDFAFKEVSIVRYRAFQWLIQSCRHLMINKDNMGFRILFSSVAQHPNAHPVCLSSFSCSYHQVPGRKHLEGYFGSQFEGLVSITVGKTWQKDEAAGHGLPTVVSWERTGSGAGWWLFTAQPQWPTSPSKVPLPKDSTSFQSNATPGHQALGHISLWGTFICRLQESVSRELDGVCMGARGLGSGCDKTLASQAFTCFFY